MQIQLSISPSHSILTADQPDQALTLGITPGAWQDSHWSANFEVTGMTRPQKKSQRKRDSNPGSSALEADALTTRPTRRSILGEGVVVVFLIAAVLEVVGGSDGEGHYQNSCGCCGADGGTCDDHRDAVVIIVAFCTARLM